MKRLRWTDVLRLIAWPIGESAELELWASVVRWLPPIAIIVCPFAIVFLVSTPMRDDLHSLYVAAMAAILMIFALAMAFHAMGTFREID